MCRMLQPVAHILKLWGSLVGWKWGRNKDSSHPTILTLAYSKGKSTTAITVIILQGFRVCTSTTLSLEESWEVRRGSRQGMWTYPPPHVHHFSTLPCSLLDMWPRQVALSSCWGLQGEGLTDGLKPGLQSFVNFSLCLPTWACTEIRIMEHG
jgi:hypothetical protein